METGDQILAWQDCPHCPTLTCTMDPDHAPLAWDDRGFLICPDCGFTRRDVTPAILQMTHRPGHVRCRLPALV